MIEALDVWRWYPTQRGRKQVLRGVSFYLPSGKNLGVCGRNGAGKSTLMRLIGQTEVPNRGTLRVEGSVSWPMGLASGMQANLSGRENARFIAWVYGLEAAQVRQLEDFVYAFSELDDSWELPVRDYSSGMRSRLTFALSMAFEFDYYLMDEIAAPGDARFRSKSRAALQAKKGRSNYIIVSQNIRQLVQEVDVIAIVDGGQVTLYDDPSAATTRFHEIMTRP